MAKGLVDVTGAVAVVVAAGAGVRAGFDPPKQFVTVGDQPMLRWSVAALAAHRRIGSVVVVVAPEHRQSARSMLADIEGIELIHGGSTRQQSVGAAIGHLESDDDPPDHVLIHDAARPGLSCRHIDDVFSALDMGHVAVAPALPVTDSVMRAGSDGELSLVARTGLMRVQTPQGFCYGDLRQALGRRSGSGEVPDEISLMRDQGAKIHLIDGDRGLIKITVPDDMLTAHRHLVRSVLRLGTGYDVHAFAPGDHLILCGVRIDHDRSLSGHSDADVGWHALTDAILGALALGDIGQHFSSSDSRWAGADSGVFLSSAGDMMAQRGYCLINADLTLICAEPKLAPRRQAMCDRTAEVLGVSPEQISIKATTTDGLGAMGRSEGIAAQAIVGLG